MLNFADPLVAPVHLLRRTSNLCPRLDINTDAVAKRVIRFLCYKRSAVTTRDQRIYRCRRVTVLRDVLSDLIPIKSEAKIPESRPGALQNPNVAKVAHGCSQRTPPVADKSEIFGQAFKRCA